MLKKIPIWIIIGIVSFILLQSGKYLNPSIDKMISLYLNSLQKTFGKLNNIQVNYISQIISSFLIYGDRDWKKLSYILATAWHETQGFKYLVERRATPGTEIYNLQNKYWNTGYYGRGFVQLTHKSNYEKMGEILKIDLVKNPDLAFNPTYAADILVIGMIRGIFTGLKLNQFINNNITDYTNARRTVNKLDKADLIASYTHDINKNLDFPIA